jgi:L-rhamnose mutarotase
MIPATAYDAARVMTGSSPLIGRISLPASAAADTGCRATRGAIVRVSLHTRLKPGAEAAYEAAHRAVPPELVAALEDAGLQEWTIWRSGLDLFHVIDCTDYAQLLRSVAALPVNVTWQARMAGLLDVVHDYSATGAEQGLPVAWHHRADDPAGAGAAD